MQENQAGTPATANRADIRLAELMGALSLATDLGMGQPMEYALCVCVLSVRLGEALGISENELREVYYLALLRHIGCNAETYRMADLFGDELALRTDFATVDSGHPSQVVGLVIHYIRQANKGSSPLHLARAIAQGLLTAPQLMKEEFTGFCEVAQRLAGRLGFDESMQIALGQVFERWDGKGLPGKAKGENLALSLRIVTLAQDAITFHRLEGVEAAVNMARERKGTAYDPRIVECFCQKAHQLLAGLEDEPPWEGVLALEPGVRSRLSVEQFDAACRAIADFADVKSPYTLGHSVGVAELAARAARRCGLPDADAVTIKQAGLLHDIGRVGVSAGIWGKPGPLSEREWERVRMHPYYTERVLARPGALKRLGTLAALHHERLDGSGYYRGLSANMLSPAARVLAAADVYQAMTEPRPHRPALAPEIAAAQLQREARAGRLDSEAVQSVLAAAGHEVRPTRRELVAGLSEREVEVLRLIARGHSKKQIASILIIAEKTVDNHIQHIYNKIGVSTRAAATLFATEHDLLAPAE
ncbi:MAG TPA: HD domain-containing phosphohydrolase [Ktedonobacteraceae bacterium]|nr:HD domain-containing phosphohydrolase [Ktedonobacteraceae bacterium]